MAGKNPFNEDETDEIKRANERDSEKVREGVDTEPKPAKDPDEPVEIDLTKVEEEDAAAKEATEESRGNRTERRRDRYREQAETARAAEERAERVERELQEERTRRVALETLQTQQRAPQQEADPEGYEILRIREERKGTFAQYNAAKAAGTLTPQQEDQFAAKAYELNDRENQAQFLRNQRIHGQRGPTQQDMAREAQKQHLLATYPDVFANPNPRVREYVLAEHSRLLALGASPSSETIARAVAGTRKEFRLGNAQRPPEPSETSRRRLSGGGAGPSGRSSGEEPTVVRMSKDQLRMAEKAFSHMKPADAHKHWAKTIGKKLAAKGVSS